MLELLKERMENISNERVSNFLNSYPIVNPESISPDYDLSVFNMPETNFGLFLWITTFHNVSKNNVKIYEKLNDGYLIYHKYTGVYFSNSNKIYKLSRTHLENDWYLHNRLFEVTQKKNIMIDIPLEGYKVNDYWYTVVERPNLQQLIDPHVLHHRGQVNKSFLEKYIDYAIKKILCVKEVFDTYKLGCPANGAPLNKFGVKDIDNFNGVFFDLKHWNCNFDEYVAQTYVSIYHYLDDHRLENIIPYSEVRPILNHILKVLETTGVNIDYIKSTEEVDSNITYCDQAIKPKTEYV